MFLSNVLLVSINKIIYFQKIKNKKIKKFKVERSFFLHRGDEIMEEVWCGPGLKSEYQAQHCFTGPSPVRLIISTNGGQNPYDKP